MHYVFPLHQAYGRDHKSAKKIRADWDNGKDFQTLGGSYTSKEDWKGKRNIPIRYVRDTKVMIVHGDK